jgi:hypothetical protein
MDPTFILNWLMRWLHIVSAVAGIGATLMMRFAVLPALARMPNGDEVLAQIRPGFKRLIHAALGTVLLTGLYNYVVVSIPKVRELKEANPALSSYHPVMGAKILVSLALFAIAILLLQPLPSMEQNRKTWLSVNVVLGLLILLLASFLRRLW